MINAQITDTNVQSNPCIRNLDLSELEYSIDFEEFIDFDDDINDIEDGNDIDSIFE